MPRCPRPSVEGNGERELKWRDFFPSSLNPVSALSTHILSRSEPPGFQSFYRNEELKGIWPSKPVFSGRAEVCREINWWDGMDQVFQNVLKLSKIHTYIHTTSEFSESESVGHSVMSDSFVTPWTVARQAPLSMGFSRQEYWSGCHSLLQGSSWPRDQTQVSCITSRFFFNLATKEAPLRARKNMNKMTPEPGEGKHKSWYVKVWAQMRTLAASFCR